MKVTLNINPIACKGLKNDLSFIRNIRDKNVDYFVQLQKEKIELLLKLRETKAAISQYQNIISEFAHKPELNTYKLQAHNDMAELESYANILSNKLHDVNLRLVAEEEKNY